MRAHVELIANDDLIWHPAELPKSEGSAWQRNLSYDEENGAASTKVKFTTAWSRPAGYHHADTEWFILSGAVQFGHEILGQGQYFRSPTGLKVPPIQVAANSEILIFREYGDFGFSVSESDKSGDLPVGGNTASSERGSLSVLDPKALTWTPNIYQGDSQRFLHVKPLFHDPSPADDHTKGFVTLLAYAPPNWQDHKIEHHPCFEESYCLKGGMDYNFGTIDPGTYFFRPALVKHGMFKAEPQQGATWLFRLDGDLINWITEHPKVHTTGIAVNYDPNDPDQAPVLAGLPVRSRSKGHWAGRGQ